MKIIRQKWELDCGIASAAMFAGVTYNKSSLADPNPFGKVDKHGGQFITGVSIKEMIELIHKLTDQTLKVNKIGYKRPIGMYGLPQEPALMIVRKNDGRPQGHWIFTDGLGHIFDPELSKIYTIKSYPRKSWHIVRTLIPE